MTLNLPQIDAKLRQLPDGQMQIYDSLRQKYVALTPEEWVRQHFVRFLTVHCGYPAHRMANEVAIRHNSMLRRCDTVVYDSYAEPLAIVEYKAPEVEITERVFDQVVRYNMVLNVRCLMASNGLRHFCCLIDGSSYRFLKSIPPYSALMPSAI